MGQADADLAFQCKASRGAHFPRDGERQVRAPLFVYRHDAAKQREALLAAREAERGERALGRGDRLVDVRFRAHRDLRERIFVRGIDHIEEFRRRRLDPGAVDEELQFVRHRMLLVTRFRSDCVGLDITKPQRAPAVCRTNFPGRYLISRRVFFLGAHLDRRKSRAETRAIAGATIPWRLVAARGGFARTASKRYDASALRDQLGWRYRRHRHWPDARRGDDDQVGPPGRALLAPQLTRAASWTVG